MLSGARCRELATWADDEYRALSGGHQCNVPLDDRGMFPDTLAPRPAVAETCRERIAQRTIALSVVATALNCVRDGLAMQQPVGQESREDWLRVLDVGA